jgi:hypothetical protein
MSAPILLFHLLQTGFDLIWFGKQHKFISKSINPKNAGCQDCCKKYNADKSTN